MLIPDPGGRQSHIFSHIYIYIYYFSLAVQTHKMERGAVSRQKELSLKPS